MKLLLYCPKSKPYLYFENDLGEDEYGMIYDSQWLLTTDSCFNKDYAVNGKIVAECDFEVSKIELHPACYNYGPAYFTKRQKPFKYFSYLGLLLASCMKDNEMLKYLSNKGGYAIHIKNLYIFNEPKELKDLEPKREIHQCIHGNLIIDEELEIPIKAPQNMMRVKLRKSYYNGIPVSNDDINANEETLEDYILISIHPEGLCKILNGEKTVELRKQILKGMISDDK